MTNDPTPGSLSLDPTRTALVLIDLQNRITALPTAPHTAAEVVARSAELTKACRNVGIPVVLVTVEFRPDGKDRLNLPSDVAGFGGAGTPPTPSDSLVVAELGTDPTDIRVVKHQWGAFYGTDLDLQLRRRGIDTIVLGGIATNFGVESTGRDAWERNYRVVFVEDAMASMAAAAHEFAVKSIFPRIGRVRTAAQVLEALTTR
ncbi:MAG TPA: hydrolase [Spirochaetia bacterium]|jgi:nicotinamidase-related amidase|nr:hydrolase [Spirochaetia bacterium]